MYDQCCTEVAGLGACGQTLGYAQLNSKDPCSRYKSIANTESDVGWRAFPVNERSTSLSIGGKKACNSVSTTKESSVRACQAACALADGCNAINFNAHAKICELVKCEDPARPNTIKSIGWLMFSFGVVDDTPVVNWIIGPEGWSDCVKKATGVTWGNSSCEMSQTRQVACMGVDGKKVDESLCLRKEPRPESSRTCWGSCGVKRSCEELRWDGLAKDASSCGSGVGLGGTELGRSLNFNHKSVGRGCYKPQTFQKAEDICKSNGARLCTVKEMNEEVTGHDPCWGALFWTSTKCPDERTGNGYWVAPALRSSSTLSNGCARPTEVASVACCSEFARTNKTRTVALKRERANGLYVIKNGYTGYCDGPGGFPCKRYEGSCRRSVIFRTRVQTAWAALRSGSIRSRRQPSRRAPVTCAAGVLDRSTACPKGATRAFHGTTSTKSHSHRPRFSNRGLSISSSPLARTQDFQRKVPRFVSSRVTMWGAWESGKMTSRTWPPRVIAPIRKRTAS